MRFFNQLRPSWVLYIGLLIAFSASGQGLKACDRSELVLDSIVQVGNEYDIHVSFCVGGGVSGSVTGADGNTKDVFFAFFSCYDSLQFSYFTPTIVSDTTSVLSVGSNLGPVQTGNWTPQGLIQYVPVNNGNFTCINSTANCGLPHTQCNPLRFRMEHIPDSIVILGLEGNGNPFFGCFGAPEFKIDLTAIAHTCVDTTPPTLVCPPTQFSADCLVGNYIPLAGISDNTDPNPVVIQDPPAGAGLFAAPTLLTIKATDSAGNADSCSFDVFIDDTLAPVANCRNVTVVLNSSGEANLSFFQVDNNSTDGCGIAFYQLSQSNFDCSDIGVQVVDLYVTDFEFNVGSCSSQVMVVDTGIHLDLPPDTILCDGAQLLLDAGQASAYQWTTGDTTQIISVNSAGNYGVTVTSLSGSGCTLADSLGVITGNSPSAAFSFSLGSGAHALDFLDLSSGSIDSHLWSFGDGDTSTALNPSHQYAGGGTYTICLSVAGVCGFDSICQTTTVVGLDLGYAGLRDLLLAPNPSSGLAWLTAREGLTMPLALALYDMRGRQVMALEMDPAGGRKALNLEALGKGIYFLRYGSEEVAGSLRVVVE